MEQPVRPETETGQSEILDPARTGIAAQGVHGLCKAGTGVLHAFTSKYALALCEAVARRVRLKHVFTERFALDDVRELLGVSADKLTTYGNLNQYAISPALVEVNALSDFTVTVAPEKTGRRVTGVLIGWSAKDIEDRKAAYAELQRPRVGPKARITGTVEEMLPSEMIE